MAIHQINHSKPGDMNTAQGRAKQLLSSSSPEAQDCSEWALGLQHCCSNSTCTWQGEGKPKVAFEHHEWCENGNFVRSSTENKAFVSKVSSHLNYSMNLLECWSTSLVKTG